MPVKPTGSTAATPAAPPKQAQQPDAPKAAAPPPQTTSWLPKPIESIVNRLENAFIPHPGTGAEAKPSLESRAKLALRGADLIVASLPPGIEAEVKKVLEGDPTADANQTIGKLSNAQLRSMNDNQLGALARDASGPALFRVLTAHGTDAGHIDAISSRLGYLESPLGHLNGPEREQLTRLLQAGAAKPGDWSGFQSYLDAATGTKQEPGTQVTPLIDGKVAFPVMYQAIDQAKTSVNMSSFGFDSDNTGWDMAKHLAAAADRGCKVRLIYDPMGSAKTNGGPTDQNIYAFLRKHGVEVIAQKPGPMADHLTHRKLLVLDGSTGFIGGMNVGDNWGVHWHDVHSEVKGTAVQDMQNLFVEQWERDGGKIPADQKKAMYPPVTPVGSQSARIIGHVGQGDQNMKLAYLRAIDTAQTSINIADPYFSDPDIVSHLEAAARRGVAVNIVLPQHNDKAIEQDAERALYGQLNAAGVHIYEYWGAPMAHEKVATFDGKISTIGSSNLDARSLGDNDESNVWTSDPKIAAQLDQDLFAKDLTQSTRMTEYKPGIFGRAMDELAHLFSKET